MGLGSYFRGIGRAVVGGAGARPDPPATDPRKGTPLQRAFAAAHVPGWPTGNPLNELQHDTSWVHVAVQKRGEHWGAAHLCVYDDSAARVRKSLGAPPDAPARKRTPLERHPALDLLKRPNPLKSQQDFLYQVSNQLDLTGGYVVWEVRNQLGLPMELWVLPRGWLAYQPPTDRHPMGLWRVYPTRQTGLWSSASRYAQGFYLDVRDTVFGGYPDPLQPGEFRSPLAACAQIVDITEKADLATWSHLVNAPRPGMIFKTAANGDPMTDEQWDQARQRLRVEHGGAVNTGNPMMLDGLEPVNTPPAALADLNSVQVREQNQKFVLSIFGVPSVVIGSLGRGHVLGQRGGAERL
jgi:phage portal protein BeeE